jgi:hypothetical protein
MPEVNLVQGYIKPAAAQAQGLLGKARQITEGDFKLTRRAFDEMKAGDPASKRPITPSSVSADTVRLVQDLREAKSNFLMEPEFAYLTSNTVTSVIIDASFDEIQNGLRAGDITRDDLRAFSDFYTFCASTLLERIENNVLSDGDKDFRIQATKRAKACAEAANALNCVLANTLDTNSQKTTVLG